MDKVNLFAYNNQDFQYTHDISKTLELYPEPKLRMQIRDRLGSPIIEFQWAMAADNAFEGLIVLDAQKAVFRATAAAVRQLEGDYHYDVQLMDPPTMARVNVFGGQITFYQGVTLDYDFEAIGRSLLPGDTVWSSASDGAPGVGGGVGVIIGDMLKAVYDADEDGVVDEAAHALLADAATHATSAESATLALNAAQLGEVDADSFLRKDQTAEITKGFTHVSHDLGSSANFVLDPTLGNYQVINNSGAFTITAPQVECGMELTVTNVAGAGPITLAGFTAAPGGGGDPYLTTPGSVFTCCIRVSKGRATYRWVAWQS
jgi:hypothetical protein